MSFEALLRVLGLNRAPVHHGSAGWTAPPSELLRAGRGALEGGSFCLGKLGAKRVVLPKADIWAHLPSGASLDPSTSDTVRQWLIEQEQDGFVRRIESRQCQARV